MADNLQTAIDYLNNSVKFDPVGLTLKLKSDLNVLYCCKQMIQKPFLLIWEGFCFKQNLCFPFAKIQCSTLCFKIFKGGKWTCVHI